jgi:hypothetical protein
MAARLLSSVHTAIPSVSTICACGCTCIAFDCTHASRRSLHSEACSGVPLLAHSVLHAGQLRVLVRGHALTSTRRDQALAVRRLSQRTRCFGRHVGWCSTFV